MTILHFCPRDEWVAARADGSANRPAPGCADLVLLEIDEDALAEPPRYEPGDPADPKGTFSLPREFRP